VETELERAVLVGSQAKDDTTPESDWDIAIRWISPIDSMKQLGKTETQISTYDSFDSLARCGKNRYPFGVRTFKVKWRSSEKGLYHAHVLPAMIRK